MTRPRKTMRQEPSATRQAISKLVNYGVLALYLLVGLRMDLWHREFFVWPLTSTERPGLDQLAVQLYRTLPYLGVELIAIGLWLSIPILAISASSLRSPGDTVCGLERRRPQTSKREMRMRRSAANLLDLFFALATLGVAPLLTWALPTSRTLGHTTMGLQAKRWG